MRFGPRTLRGRLTTLFAVGSATVVVAGGFLLYADVTRKAEEGVNRSLERRAATIAEAISQGTSRLPRTEPFAQVVVRSPFSTSILTYSALIDQGQFLLTPGQIDQVYAQGPQRIDRVIPELGGRARLLAVPFPLSGNVAVIVVGSSLEAEAAERDRLLLRLAMAGPVFVGLFSLGGWLLAGAALRPVLRMTDEAAVISTAENARRLAIPRGSDEIAHLGRTLNDMLDRIETSFKRERAFVDDASHELRTPLAIMRAEVELALLQPGDGAETQATLESLHDEILRLSRLADDLLVLARAGAGQLEPSTATVPLLDTARAAVERLRPTLRAGLTVDLHGEAVDVRAHPDRIHRILANLVVNADRFAAHRLLITVTDESDDGDGRPDDRDARDDRDDRDRGGRATPRGAVLQVADDGGGFPAELLPRVFERFTMGEEARTRRSQGAGIGLAIVRALVEADGGSAVAENGGPLGGATVTIRYPLEAKADADSRTELRTG